MSNPSWEILTRRIATGNWVFLLGNGHFSSSLSVSTNINSPKSPFDGVCLSGQIIMCQILWTMTMCPLVCHRVSPYTDDDGCLSRIRKFPYLQFNIKTRHRHRHRPRFRAHSLSLSELLPNMLIKEELGGSSPLRLLLFGQALKNIVYLIQFFGKMSFTR